MHNEYNLVGKNMLIAKSDTQEAKKFKKWLSNEFSVMDFEQEYKSKNKIAWDGIGVEKQSCNEQSHNKKVSRRIRNSSLCCNSYQLGICDDYDF